MPSATSFLLISLVVYASIYGVMKLATSSRQFKSQPLEDQQRARKSLKLGLVFTPFGLLGTYLLLGAPSAVLSWIPIVLYLGLWAFALWFVWRAYCLGVKRSVRHAKGSRGKVLRNPERALGRLALVNLCVGVGLIAVLVMIPAWQLPLNSWAAMVAVLTGAYTVAMQRIEKRDGTQAIVQPDSPQTPAAGRLAARTPGPQLSPGQQHPSSEFSRRRLLILLIPCLVLVWLWNTPYPPIREYKLYFTEDRKSVELSWNDLSESWTEAHVKRHFQGHKVRCMPDETGMPGVDRVCVVDMKSLSGVPTMTANFLFARDRLTRVASNIPWWSHAKGLDALRRAYGSPHAAQDVQYSGVRLLGWRLEGGGFVFYNRDPERNPLQTNSIQWVGPSQCTPSPCILPD